MNRTVLSNSRTMLGLIVSVLLSITAVVLAVTGNGYWVLFVLAALWTSFFSIKQADKVTKQDL